MVVPKFQYPDCQATSGSTGPNGMIIWSVIGADGNVACALAPLWLLAACSVMF